MGLIIQQRALQAVAGVRQILPVIRKRDRSLFDQIHRAMNSVVLNIAEADGNDAGTARARFASACGSAKEVRAGLQLTVAYGYVPGSKVDSHRRLTANTLTPRSSRRMSTCGGAWKKARYGAESTSQVPICKTATTADWRARRGEACVVKALKCVRPQMQAEPFGAAPCRAFFQAPVRQRQRSMK